MVPYGIHSRRITDENDVARTSLNYCEILIHVGTIIDQPIVVSHDDVASD